MGDVYRRMGEYAKSTEMYEKALKLNPTSWPHISIATNLIKMGEQQKARNQLYQGLEIASSYLSLLQAHLFLAISYIAEGDLENTLREMETRVNLAKEKSDTLEIARNQFKISEILYENGKIKEAEEKVMTGKEFMGSAELSEEEKNTLWNLYIWHSTRLMVKKGKLDQAKEYAEMYKTRSEKNDDPAYLTLSGLIANAEENYEKAISYLNQANLGDPFPKPFTDYHLALAYLKNGEETKAIKILESVVNYNALCSLTNEMTRVLAEKQLVILKEVH
jgi:tetratricopeptide (TPR) repeat protein